jgi:glycerol uptake facilitator-like aquaporin
VLILLFGPVSGAHFNPVVSVVDWLLGRGRDRGLGAREVAAYSVVQVAGSIAGALLANAMYGVRLLELSSKHRGGAGLLIGEIVATAGLIALVFALARSGRTGLSAAAVGAYIGAAYWFTSSTAFANPAVTVGRMFSDTFAGIAPASAPGFVIAQCVGGLIGLGLVVALYPDAGRGADAAVVPHEHEEKIK